MNEKNFLGSGRSVKLSASVSDTAADYRIGLTEPYFLNRNLSGSFEVFNEDVQADTVDIERTGFSTSVYFGAADDYYHRVGYDLAKNSTTQKSSEATSLTGEENKSLTSSSVRYTWAGEHLTTDMTLLRAVCLRLQRSIRGWAAC